MFGVVRGLRELACASLLARVCLRELACASLLERILNRPRESADSSACGLRERALARGLRERLLARGLRESPCARLARGLREMQLLDKQLLDMQLLDKQVYILLYPDGKRNNTNVLLSIRVANAIKPLFVLLIRMGNAIKPFLFLLAPFPSI